MSAPPSSFWASVISWFTPTVLFVFLNLTIGTIFFTSSLNKPSSSHIDPNKQQHRHQNDSDDRRLPRSPSMLQRIKSVNFYSYRSQEPEKSPDSDTHFAPHQIVEQEQIDSYPPLSRSPSVLQRLKSINLQSYFSHEPTSRVESEPVTHTSPETKETHSDSDEMEDEAGEEQTLEEIYSQLKVAQVSRTKSDTAPASGEIPTKLPKKMRKSASTKSAFAHFEEEDIVVEKRRPATVREGKVKDPDDADEEVDAKADDFINRFKHQLKLQRLDSIIRYKEVIGRGGG